MRTIFRMHPKKSPAIRALYNNLKPGDENSIGGRSHLVCTWPPMIRC